MYDITSAGISVCPEADDCDLLRDVAVTSHSHEREGAPASMTSRGLSPVVPVGVERWTEIFHLDNTFPMIACDDPAAARSADPAGTRFDLESNASRDVPQELQILARFIDRRTS